MKPSSEQRIRSSQANGKLSRGPKTEAGKRRSSQNALRHGLFSKSLALENERDPGFIQLRKEYRDHFRPRNSEEQRLVDEMAAAFWNMRLARAIETERVSLEFPPKSLGLLKHESRFQYNFQKSLRRLAFLRRAARTQK